MTDEKKDRKADFETALAELEKIVERMEGAEQTLDQAMQDFERGMALSQRCRKSLDEAQLKVDQLVRKYDRYELEPVDMEVDVPESLNDEV